MTVGKYIKLLFQLYVNQYDIFVPSTLENAIICKLVIYFTKIRPVTLYVKNYVLYFRQTSIRLVSST